MCVRSLTRPAQSLFGEVPITPCARGPPTTHARRLCVWANVGKNEGEGEKRPTTHPFKRHHGGFRDAAAGEERAERTPVQRARHGAQLIDTIAFAPHPQVLASQEYRMRMKGGRDATHIPVFEGARKAVAVVECTRAARAGAQNFLRPRQCERCSDLLQDWRASRFAQPCCASRASPRQIPLDVPKMQGCRGVDRMICVFQVGAPGEGVDSILSSSPAGRMVCSCVTPIALKPLPSGAVGEAALPRPSYWVPGGGMHALD